MVGKRDEAQNALDLDLCVFTGGPKQIAASVKRSAIHSTRRKGTLLQSVSMLNFHKNQGGKGLTAWQRNRLEQAKNELPGLFGENQQFHIHNSKS